METVFVVMQRGEEYPDSVWTTEEAAKERARELGSPEDALSFQYQLDKDNGIAF